LTDSIWKQSRLDDIPDVVVSFFIVNPQHKLKLSPKISAPSKPCDMTYISKTTLRFLNSNQKSPPPHIGVNQFSAYPVAENDNIQSYFEKSPDRSNKMGIEVMVHAAMAFRFQTFGKKQSSDGMKHVDIIAANNQGSTAFFA